MWRVESGSKLRDVIYERPLTLILLSPISIRSVAMPRVEVGMSEFKMFEVKMSEVKMSGFEVFAFPRFGASIRFCHKFEFSDFSEKFSNKFSEEVSSVPCSCW